MANLQGQFSSKEGGSCYKKAPSVLLNTLIDLDTQNKARAKFEIEDLNCSAFQRQKKLEFLVYSLRVEELRKERKRITRTWGEMGRKKTYLGLHTP